MIDFMSKHVNFVERLGHLPNVVDTVNVNIY
jgi:hypothetical protein